MTEKLNHNKTSGWKATFENKAIYKALGKIIKENNTILVTTKGFEYLIQVNDTLGFYSKFENPVKIITKYMDRKGYKYTITNKYLATPGTVGAF